MAICWCETNKSQIDHFTFEINQIKYFFKFSHWQSHSVWLRSLYIFRPANLRWEEFQEVLGVSDRIRTCRLKWSHTWPWKVARGRDVFAWVAMIRCEVGRIAFWYFAWWISYILLLYLFRDWLIVFFINKKVLFSLFRYFQIYWVKFRLFIVFIVF